MTKSETLRAQELYELFLDSDAIIEDLLQTGYPAIVLHSNSTLFHANDAFCNITQYSQKEIIGLNAWLLFPAKSIDTVIKNLTEQSTVPYQVVALKKDGTEFVVELKGINFELAGEPVRAILVKQIET